MKRSMDWHKREKRKKIWAIIAAVLTCLAPSALLIVGLIFPCMHVVLWAGLALTIVLLVVWAVPMAKQIARVRVPGPFDE